MALGTSGGWMLGAALAASAALGAPSPLVLNHEQRVGSTFALQSIRYDVDGQKLFEATTVPEGGRVAEQRIAPGLHTLSVEIVYVGRSGVFRYLSGYRFRLRTRATVSLREGDALAVKTSVEERVSPTQEWQDSLRWRLEGNPARAVLDVENLPVTREPLDEAPGGAAQVSPDAQARAEAKAQEAVQDVLREADRAAPVADAGSDEAERAGCAAPPVHFAFGQFRLAPAAQATLAKLAGCLRRNRSAGVTVEGHCDQLGSAAFNQELGKWRAESAVRFLVEHGVPSARLRAVSYGNQRLLCGEPSEACRAKNRRAQFTPGPAAMSNAEPP